MILKTDHVPINKLRIDGVHESLKESWDDMKAKVREIFVNKLDEGEGAEIVKGTSR